MRVPHLVAGLILLFPPIAVADNPRVVTSIEPVYRLTASIMQGSGTPQLLIKHGQSPHDFMIKPSTARRIHGADLIIWIGPELETHLASSIESLVDKERSLALINTDLPTVLPIRQTGSLNADKRAVDPHIWLDPHNARAIAITIAEKLKKLDPDNAPLYLSNARALIDSIKSNDKKHAALLHPYTERPYLSLHDSYQYFEHHHGLSWAGSVSIDTHHAAGAKRIAFLRRLLDEQDIACVVYDPLSPHDLLKVLLEGRDTPSVTADPLGRDAGDDYLSILQAVAAGFERCLSGNESPM